MDKGTKKIEIINRTIKFVSLCIYVWMKLNFVY